MCSACAGGSASVLALLLGGLTTSLAAPAWACGCGAYIPDQHGASVVDERALIAWDGSREDILMSLRVTGSSDSAAWVMPVPSAAQVSLGEAEVVRGTRTAHRSAHRVPRLVVADVQLADRGRTVRGRHGRRPARTGVNVLGRQRIGPFDVTRLAAQDPAALAKWLTDNGFPHPDGLDANLAPYVADGWEIVAVKLAPAATGESLTGDLQPLRLSFASDAVVYPMRLSRSASTPQTVDLSSSPTIEWTRPPFRWRTTRRRWSSRANRRLRGLPRSRRVRRRRRISHALEQRLLEPASIDGDYTSSPRPTTPPISASSIANETAVT